MLQPKPSTGNRKPGKAATLQLCDDSNGVIIDLVALGCLPPELASFLSKKRLAGVNIGAKVGAARVRARARARVSFRVRVRGRSNPSPNPSPNPNRSPNPNPDQVGTGDLGKLSQDYPEAGLNHHRGATGQSVFGAGMVVELAPLAAEVLGLGLLGLALGLPRSLDLERFSRLRLTLTLTLALTLTLTLAPILTLTLALALARCCVSARPPCAASSCSSRAAARGVPSTSCLPTRKASSTWTGSDGRSRRTSCSTRSTTRQRPSFRPGGCSTGRR